MALRESPLQKFSLKKPLGWKEFELEVMRDKKGTFVVVCSIENVDPCGVHTGDSIAVAPQQTLSDREYQEMRSEAKKIISAIGVETGGANIQFAVHPVTRERLVIEMNPRREPIFGLSVQSYRLSHCKNSGLAGYGAYTLEEISNDITGTTPSCYEPALDYIVTKCPRFDFNKYEGAKDSLNHSNEKCGRR